MGINAEFVAPLVAQADELARRLREWSNQRIAQQVEQLVVQQLTVERRTIDVRVVKLFNERLPVELEQALKKDHRTLALERHRLRLSAKRHIHRKKRDEENRKWLSWFFGGVGQVIQNSANMTVFFFLWGVSAAFWGWVGGINTPPTVFCQTQQSLCYRLRIWGAKSALSDMPKPQCTKTPLGLSCLFPSQPPQR